MKQLKLIAEQFALHNITCFLVGGCVRDSILGIESDDIDICLVGVRDTSVVMQVLSEHATNVAEEVGNKFPVWIATIPELGKVDFALARTERKDGMKRQDFFVDTHNVSIEDDLKRRDLTINAMARNVLTGELVDPFNGCWDLIKKIARPVSEAFAEDTLRVIRAARFCGRFDLVPSQELIDMCRSLKPTDISNERIGMELAKALKQCTKFSVFLNALWLFGWTEHVFGQELRHSVQMNIDELDTPLLKLAELMRCHSPKQARQLADRFDDISLWTKKEVHQAWLLQDCAGRFGLRCTTLRVDVMHAKNELSKAGVDFENLLTLLRFKSLEEEDWNVLDLCATLSVEPVVTGAMLKQEGFKQGKEMGEKLKQLLDLQFCGLLDESNWKTHI